MMSGQVEQGGGSRREARRTVLVAVLCSAIVASVVGASAAWAAGRITSADIRDETIRGRDIRNGQVGASDIGDGAVRAAEIAAGAVGRSELGVDSVTGTAIGELPSVSTGGFAQNVPSTSAFMTLVPVSTISIDWDSSMPAGTITSAFHVAGKDGVVIPAGLEGAWLVSASVEWQTSVTTSAIQLTEVKQLGTSQLALETTSPPAAVASFSNTSAVTRLNAGDEVQVRVMQTNGGNSTRNGNVRLTLVRLSDAVPDLIN